MAAVEPIIVSILGNSTELDASLASAGASIKAFGASASLSFAGVGAAVTSAGASIKAFGATMTAVGMSMSVLVTAPILAVGAAALLAANNVQKAYAIIIAGTGATGAKLQGLETQFDNLASTIPNSFTDTATVLTTVNNKLSEGGYAITQISKNILDVSRMTGESASSLASDFTAAIQSWGVSAKNTESFMNQVYTAAQAARVPVTSILTDLTTYKPVIESAGFSLQQMIPIIGDLESKGLDVARTMQGMAYAWANLSKDMAAPSKTTQKMVDDVTKSMKDAGIQGTTTADQLQGVFYGIQHGLISSADAAAIFGPRFADNVFQVIKDGNLTAAQFIALSKGMSLNLNTLGASTITFAQSIDIMKNALEIALNPLGEKMIAAFQQLMPLIKDTIGVVGELASGFAALPTPVADALFVIVGLAAAIGPALILIGGLVSAFGTIVTAVGAVITAIPVAVGVLALLAPVLVIAAVAVGALTVIIGPLVAALYLAYTSSAALRGAFGDLEGALGTAGGAFETLGSHIASGLGYLISGNYKAAFTSFTTGFNDMWNTISNIHWLELGQNLVTQISVGITTNMPKVVAALGEVITGAKKTWDTVSKDFTTWVNGVNWTAESKKIPAAIIAGLKDIQKDLTPVWNTIETSFTTWRDSVPWATLASQIPIDISNAIKLSMATIGPVWDYIQISLMNAIQGINWNNVGLQVGQGLRYAIKLALDSLVGGISDLIPTALITAGQPNLIGVGITAAKNFVSGFQSGLGDLWKLIMDGLEPLAGKIADYMETQVDWKGIGTFIGNILGSIVAGLVGAPLAEMNSTGGPTAADQQATLQSNILGSTGAFNVTQPTSGYSKLQTAASDAGSAMATGFTQGAQDAMAKINWGDIIKNAILNSIGLGSGKPSSSQPGTGAPGTGGPMSAIASLTSGGILGDSSLEPWNNMPPGSPSLASLTKGGILGSSQDNVYNPANWKLPSWADATKGGPLAGVGLPSIPAFPNLGLFGSKSDKSSQSYQRDPKTGKMVPVGSSGQSASGVFGATIDLPGKIMGLGASLGSVDWGKLMKGGILDGDEWAKLGKGITGYDWGKAMKGGILDPETWTKLGGSLSSGAGKVVQGAQQVGATIVGGAKSIWDFITGGAKSIWDFITGAPKEIWTWIRGEAKTVWTWITGEAHDIWTYITGGAHDIWTYITGGAHDIWSYITGGARDIWSYITGTGRDIWTYITGTGRDIWSYITGAGRDIWANYITGGAKSLWGDIITGGSRAVSDVITGTIDIMHFITGAIPAPSTTPVNPNLLNSSSPDAQSAAGAANLTAAQKAGFHLPGAMPWSGPATTPIAAQTGAIFNARSGGIHALLAEAGEAEMVVPQNRWGESWTNLIRTLPHFGAGGIIGKISSVFSDRDAQQSEQQSQQAGPVNFYISFPNATITNKQEAEKIGLQIANSAQRELSRSGYSRGS